MKQASTLFAHHNLNLDNDVALAWWPTTQERRLKRRPSMPAPAMVILLRTIAEAGLLQVME